MGDIDGRQLIFSLGSMDKNDTQSLSLRSALPAVFSNLQGFNDPVNFDALRWEPITIAKVVGLAKRDSFTELPPERYRGGTKPIFIEADIVTQDILQNTGQSTGACPLLAETIRNRGYGAPKDDCGHIIAKKFGGKMVDYNLFPQCMEINRGLGVWSRIWKWGIELIIQLWLLFFVEYDPMVRFRVLLIYPGEGDDKPDRPVGLHYHMEFYLRDGERKRNEEERRANITAMRVLIRTVIAAEVPNSCMLIDGVKCKAAMQNFCNHMRQLRAMTEIMDLRAILDLYIAEIEQSLVEPRPPEIPQPQRPTPLSANRPFSWWDLVPVYGSVRSLEDAVRCGRGGDIFGAAFNTTLGIGGLALDVLSLGTITTFAKVAAKEASKTVVKEVVKEGTKTAAKSVAQIIVTKALVIATAEVAKESLIALAQTAVVQTTRRVLAAMARQLPDDF